MRAPLLVGVAFLAGGILAGAQRSVPVGDGPLVILALTAAIAAGVLAGRGSHGHRAGWAVMGLLAMAGALLGVGARIAVDRGCAARLPPDVPLFVRGDVVGAAGDRVDLALDGAEVGGEVVPCVGSVSGRFDGGLPPPGAGIVGKGRWWRPPGSGGMRVGGLLLLDSLAVERPPTESRGVRGRWRRRVGAVRSAARARVDDLFGARAPLAASLLLAQRDGLDREVRDRFARAGLSHLLAISGLHVGLVAGILLVLAGVFRLGKGAGAGMAALGTVVYVLFLGAPHSAARAAVQILLVLGARAAQRPARTEAMIAAAALILLAVDPAALFSPGFQLSFAGVAGILALRRPLLVPIRRMTRPGGRAGRWVADGLATSLAATLATAPIVAWHFGRVAPVGIVANLLAIPLLSVTVPALAAALALGQVWAAAGHFIAGAGMVLLGALDATARAAAGVPGGTVPVPPSMAVVMTSAALLGYVATRRLGRVRPGLRGLMGAGVAAAVVAVSPVRPTVDRIEIHVIDVGQGDAIAVRSPAGRWVLVDAGVATDSYDAGARLVVPYLGRRGVQRLEGLVVTHPDADHMGGAGSVMAALRPHWVADPGVPAPKAGYLALLKTAAAGGVRWVALRRGMDITLDGMVVQVLHPDETAGLLEANDASVVLRVVYGEFEALLTGDAPTEVERDLVRLYGRRLEADVLKVGHHGSRTSTGPELLEATGARLAVISAGRGNRYGHPHRSVLKRLRDSGLAIWRTDLHGSLVIRGTSDGQIEVESERGRVRP